MKPLLLTTTLALIALASFSQQIQKINECVIEKGMLKMISVDYDLGTGERTIVVDGTRRKFYDLYPQDGKEYAAKTTWYINNDPVTYKGSNFIKYGLPRILGTTEITRSGDFQGIGVYTEAGLAESDVEVIYIPVRSGCEFQPYQKVLPLCANVKVKASKAQVKEGETITFASTVTDAGGTKEYKWRVYSGKIVGSDNTSTLKVSTTGFTGQLTVELAVTVKEKRCETAYQNATVEVKKK